MSTEFRDTLNEEIHLAILKDRAIACEKAADLACTAYLAAEKGTVDHKLLSVLAHAALHDEINAENELETAS